MDLYVVTGTTRGLGAAFARLLGGREGLELVTLARREATIVVDLADAAALDRACAQLAHRCAGKPWAKAVLINNAGAVEPVGPVETLDAAGIARSLAVNLAAPLALMAAFLGATGAVPLRRVINISSGAGRRPIGGWGAYCTAKAGLDMASRVAALEAKAKGARVEVVSLAPGVFDTDMQATVRAQPEARFADVARFRQMKAEGTLRPPEDVAADILRLEAEGRLAREPVEDLRDFA